MSIVDYSVLKSGDSGQDPPFKSDESGLHGDAEFPIAVYHADVTDNFVSWHWHEELEFGYAVEGSVLMECGKSKHILNKGDIYFINSNTLHAMFKAGTGQKSVFRSVVVHGSIVGGKEDSIYHRKYVAPITGNSGLRELIFTPKDGSYSRYWGCSQTSGTRKISECPITSLSSATSFPSFSGYLSICRKRICRRTLPPALPRRQGSVTYCFLSTTITPKRSLLMTWQPPHSSAKARCSGASGT